MSPNANRQLFGTPFVYYTANAVLKYESIKQMMRSPY